MSKMDDSPEDITWERMMTSNDSSAYASSDAKSHWSVGISRFGL